MPKKGKKIRELAVELGISAHDLLVQCRELDLPVQNTISKLSPAEEATIRSLAARPGRQAGNNPPQTERPNQE